MDSNTPATESEFETIGPTENSTTINVKKPLLQYVNKITQNKRKIVAVQRNGNANSVITHLNAATPKFTIIF